MLMQKVQDVIRDFSGLVGVYYKNLRTGESFGINDDRAFVAASVIKIPVMVEVFNQVEQGKLTLGTMLEVRDADKVPSCGAIRLMHTGLNVTVQDLCYLMIDISDNTATNILINQVEMEQINATMQHLGLKETRANRLLFDVKAKECGLQNYFAPREIGLLLEQMWRGELVSPAASCAMIEILLNQQLNSKIPYYLRGVSIAHKTGEDDGTTHDVGIVYAEEPFILCLASNDTYVPDTENGFREIARLCYEHSRGNKS